MVHIPRSISAHGTNYTTPLYLEGRSLYTKIFKHTWKLMTQVKPQNVVSCLGFTK